MALRNVRRLFLLLAATACFLSWNYATMVPWWAWACVAAPVAFGFLCEGRKEMKR